MNMFAKSNKSLYLFNVLYAEVLLLALYFL